MYTCDYPRVGAGVDAVVHGLLRGSRDACVQSLLRVRPWQERGLGAAGVLGIAVHKLHLPTPPARRATLRAWRHLPASCADVALVVVGDGELANVYREQVEYDG